MKKMMFFVTKEYVFELCQIRHDKCRCRILFASWLMCLKTVTILLLSTYGQLILNDIFWLRMFKNMAFFN